MKNTETIKHLFKSQNILNTIFLFFIFLFPISAYTQTLPESYFDDVTNEYRSFTDRELSSINAFQGNPTFQSNLWIRDPETGEYWEQMAHTWRADEIAETGVPQATSVEEGNAMDLVFLARNPETGEYRRFYGSFEELQFTTSGRNLNREVNAANLDQETTQQLLSNRDLLISGGSRPGGLIDCDGPECDIGNLMRTINKIIAEMIKIAVAVVSIIFAYAGWIYMTAAGDTSKISQAHGMFKKAAVGFAIVLTAYLLVKILIDVTDAESRLMIDWMNRNN